MATGAIYHLHRKGLQAAPVAYWQAYFTDKFIGERWHRPESTPRTFNTFNLSFGASDISLSRLNRFAKTSFQQQNYKANIWDDLFIIMEYHNNLSCGSKNSFKTN